MTDHLPECRAHDIPGWTVGDCICAELRACEQRVRMEDDDYAYVAAQADADGRWRGWGEALDAARETVLAYADNTHKHIGMLKCWPENGDRCNITAALRVAAQKIDALREEKP